jgi:hypothetical protein
MKRKKELVVVQSVVLKGQTKFQKSVDFKGATATKRRGEKREREKRRKTERGRRRGMRTSKVQKGWEEREPCIFESLCAPKDGWSSSSPRSAAQKYKCI